MHRLEPSTSRVLVQSVTYQDSVGAYRLKGWLSSKKMEDHVAVMARKGWKVLNAVQTQGDVRRDGPALKRTTITLIYGKMA